MAKREPKSHRTGNEVVREDGRIEYEYSDGAWRFETGALARRHPASMALFDSETGTAVINGRYREVREAREQALILAGKQLNPAVATVADAAALITKAQFELATSPDWAGASTNAAKYIDRTTDLIQESTKQEGNTITLTLTDATAARVLERLANRSGD